MIQHLNRHHRDSQPRLRFREFWFHLHVYLSDSDSKPLSHPEAKQQTLKETLHVKQKTPFNSPRSTAITNQIGKIIVTDPRPYTSVEKPGFTGLLHVLEPKYEACNIEPTTFMS